MLATTGCAGVLSLGNDGGTDGGRLLELYEQGNLPEISIGLGWYPRNSYFVALRYAGYLDRTGCHRYHSCRRILQRGMDDRVLAIATSWRDQSLRPSGESLTLGTPRNGKVGSPHRIAEQEGCARSGHHRTTTQTSRLGPKNEPARAGGHPVVEVRVMGRSSRSR